MQHFTVKLPVKKYIQKYLTTLYGDIIPAKMETEIGFVFLNTIASRLESQVTRGYVDLWENRYNSSVTFSVSYHYFYLTKKEISKFTCILLNRYFENKFVSELCSYVELHDSNHGDIKKTIEGFAYKYNIEIEEDIAFDSLKKMEYRARKKNNEKSLCRLSPQLSIFSATA